MYPQSELDNYKLQVELLQEKLQRSEISRQQLEHKLDKILQKRDEHDKIQRSKSKHKYQEFLEEQQRRNERNKQLVQMLERIEQQTIAMNSRSERLKMMKLQYEMYFAKLVHSQTRRCIQSSTIPVMTPMMGTANVPLPMPQAMMMPTTGVEGYNYTKVYEEPPFRDNSFQRYVDSSTDDRELLNRPQRGNMSAKLMEMPMSSDYTVNLDRNDYRNIRMPESYQIRQKSYEPIVTDGNMDNRVPFNNFNPEMNEPKIDTIQTELEGNLSSAGVSGLLDKNKQYTDLEIPSTVSSSTTPSAFNNVPNTHNQTNIGKQTSVSSSFSPGDRSQSIEVKQWTNALPTQHMHSFEINSIASGDGTVTELASSHQSSTDFAIDKSPNYDIYQEKSKMFQEDKPTERCIPTNMNNTIQETEVAVVTKAKENEPVLLPSVHKPIAEPETTATRINTDITTAMTTQNPTSTPAPIITSTPTPAPIITSTPTLAPAPTSRLTSASILTPTPTLTPTSTLTPTPTKEPIPTPAETPVSIENIENAIYGELVNSPEETQKTQQPDKPIISSTLLENLVTQPAVNNEPSEIASNMEKEEAQQYVPDAKLSSYDTTSTAQNVEDRNENPSYEQIYDFNNTTPTADGGTGNNMDYAAYENSSTVDDNNQQQQQYDYSNYDPSQYSYPGYIYDETTGEYKPDPNATAEQYATDQQYAQNYEQQYQQQEGYDYSQGYDQQDPQAAATDPAAYENYDVTQTQGEQPNITSTTEMVTPQQELQQPETPTVENTTPEDQPVEVVETSIKSTKPTSILATKKEQQDKKDTQKNKKRVNFVDSSETDESSADKGQTKSTIKPSTGNESDFDFSSSSETSAKKA